MKSYNEIANNVFERREHYETQKKKNRKIVVQTAAPICCICLIAVLGFGAWKSGVFGEKQMQTAEDSLIVGEKDWYGPGEEDPTGKANTQESPFEDSNVLVGGGSYSSETESSMSKSVAIGIGFSEKEIEDYIQKNSQNLLQIIKTEYSFEINSVWINKKGYCHASCDNGNKVNLNYVTLPILVNKEIYASVTLVKTDEGGIIETVNIGGDTWKNYNSIILANPETPIVFAYLPNAMGEIMISPDNTAINPVDGKIQDPIAVLNPDINWYELLKTEYNTVSGEQILNPNNNAVIL